MIAQQKTNMEQRVARSNCRSEVSQNTKNYIFQRLEPTILKPFSERSQTSQAGRQLRLSCKAEHDPNLLVKYVWRIDGLPIDQSKIENGQIVNIIRFCWKTIQVIDENNNLIIENPTHYDTGEYSCTATTKLDSATKVVQISIQDVPNPVYGGYVSKCDEKTATATINFEHLEPKSTVVPVKEFW